MPVTRLAPSPTGALHLGNARTFLINWAMARSRGWRIVLRIEDLDGPRIKPGAADGAIRILEALGIDWDEGPIIQSHDLEPYHAAMRALAGRALAYPSDLTRAQIEAAASAPQESEGPAESRFPPELRPPITPRAFDHPETNWRFVTPGETVEFNDGFAGPQRHRPIDTIGDFVIWTRRGQPAYQLAVVVDDARQGVTHVVRGDDLLDSAARQILLYQALHRAVEAGSCGFDAFAPGNFSRIPSYTHLPLVVGPDGRRLAKRHGDTRLDHYLSRGVPPEHLVGLIAWWSGMRDEGRSCPRPMSAAEFRERFDLSRLPRERVVFQAADDRWLLNG